MTQEFVLNLAQEALTTALLLAAPYWGWSLLVGITISLLQATTRSRNRRDVHPQDVAVIAGVLLMGRWMLNTLLEFYNRDLPDGRDGGALMGTLCLAMVRITAFFVTAPFLGSKALPCC